MYVCIYIYIYIYVYNPPKGSLDAPIVDFLGWLNEQEILILL